MEDQVLPTLLGKCIARVVKTHLEEKGVNVLVDERVSRIYEDQESGMRMVATSQGTIGADIVILATGVRPQYHAGREGGTGPWAPPAVSSSTDACEQAIRIFMQVGIVSNCAI